MGNAFLHVKHETKINIFGAAGAGKAAFEQAFSGDLAAQEERGGMKVFVLYHILTTGPECLESCRSCLSGEPRFKVREDVVFVVIAIGDYDVDVAGQDAVLAGLQILHTVLLDPMYATQYVVVYLNKFDIFCKKIAASTTEALQALPCFQTADGEADYAGPDGDVEAAYEYMEAKVLKVHERTASTHVGGLDVQRCTATDEGAVRRDSQQALCEFNPQDLARSRRKTDAAKGVGSIAVGPATPSPLQPVSEDSAKKQRGSIFDFSMAYAHRDTF